MLYEVITTMNGIDRIVKQNAASAEVFSSAFIKLNGQSERLSFFIRKLKGLVERRRHIRVKIGLRGKFHLSDGTSEPFRTFDISASGCSIIASRPFEEDTGGEIEFFSTHIHFPKLRAKVVRQDNGTDEEVV